IAATTMTNTASKFARLGSSRSSPVAARTRVLGLPQGFRYHDLRHYFASLLIASGSDVRIVQARVRHASAKTTLDCYGRLWPDWDEFTRAAVDAVLSARFQDHAGSMRAGKRSR